MSSDTNTAVQEMALTFFFFFACIKVDIMTSNCSTTNSYRTQCGHFAWPLLHICFVYTKGWCCKLPEKKWVSRPKKENCPSSLVFCSCVKLNKEKCTTDSLKLELFDSIRIVLITFDEKLETTIESFYYDFLSSSDDYRIFLYRWFLYDWQNGWPNFQ